MKKKQLLSALLLIVCGTSAGATGFSKLQVSDSGHPDLSVGLWYPTEQAEPSVPNTEFGHPLAVDALMSETNRGLIVISHGYSGWYAGHADTAKALADEGFVVAAPSHTGNTWSDMSSSIDQWLLDRPRHVSRVIDHVLNDEKLKQHVDADKIGVYGFSAGGYTGVGLIGGVPDLEAAQQHCLDDPQESVCADGMITAMVEAGMDKLPVSAWGADERIRAVSLSAPGFGFAYTADSFKDVSAKVQLWSGELDVRVPTASNAAWLASQLPVIPETHWVDKANHFAFMVVPCRDAFKRDDPEEYEIVCGDADGFDRYQFHDDMHVEMARFFSESLNVRKMH